MTTVHTIEDLVRVLDERPDWTEALRARILTRELLNLPQAFAEFAENTERRLAALEAGQAALADTLVKVMESTERRLGVLEAGQDRLSDDTAPLKAAHARNSALRIVARIARVANCREHRVLDLGDILDLIDDSDTSGIAQNELISFENADIIIEATPRDNGAVHYIAVEASYTAGRKDARRAIRNAEYMTRFTGRPAHAVVAAQRVNPAIAHLIENGELHWAQILQKELETD